MASRRSSINRKGILTRIWCFHWKFQPVFQAVEFINNFLVGIRSVLCAYVQRAGNIVSVIFHWFSFLRTKKSYPLQWKSKWESDCICYRKLYWPNRWNHKWQRGVEIGPKTVWKQHQITNLGRVIATIKPPNPQTGQCLWVQSDCFSWNPNATLQQVTSKRGVPVIDNSYLPTNSMIQGADCVYSHDKYVTCSKRGLSVADNSYLLEESQ